MFKSMLPTLRIFIFMMWNCEQLSHFPWLKKLIGTDWLQDDSPVNWVVIVKLFLWLLKYDSLYCSCALYNIKLLKKNVRDVIVRVNEHKGGIKAWKIMMLSSQQAWRFHCWEAQAYDVLELPLVTTLKDACVVLYYFKSFTNWHPWDDHLDGG